MGQRYRRLVVASCCIWLLTVVALVSCQNAPDVTELRSLATDGAAAAQFDLGDRYRTGLGVPQDNGEALRWYRLAADQGHARAQASLGFIYGNGEGVPQDDGEAIRWFRLAADQGYVKAQFILGLMYGSGQGVPQDYITAYMWVDLAAAQGHENAREARDTLAEAMSAEQIAAAQRAAREVSGVATADERPAIVPEPDWTAHAYTVVRDEDISSSIRIRRRLWIVAPTAQTPEARIATLMEAALQVHRQSYPQFLSAFLLPFDTADDAMARINPNASKTQPLARALAMRVNV